MLVVHHGRLPRGASPDPGSAALPHADVAPVSGGALRAWVHAQALRGAGHDVRTLARAQDDDGAPVPGALPGFRSTGDLRRLAEAAAPDWILAVAPEEAPALAPVAPLVVDLYAPRLLEAAFEGLQREEAGRALRAIAAADEVLVSNPRQRWFWAGLLGAAGWDLSRPAGLLVPLAALPGPPRHRPPRPTFVLGGHPWPWQDAGETLARAVAHLRGRADVQSFGHPPVDGTHAAPLASRAAWLHASAGAVAALDRYAPNPERALALSFRQVDHLGCGTPLIADADGPLADELRATGAGWVDAPLEDALDDALAAWSGAAPAPDVATLAARYAPTVTEAPLVAWTPRRRDRSADLLRPGARLAATEAAAARDRARREAAETEVAAKRHEIEQLNVQVRALASAVEAASAAVADVAAFRRETSQVLGTRLAGQAAEAEHLRRELEVVKADLDKKNVELRAAQEERDRVGRTLAFFRNRAR